MTIALPKLYLASKSPRRHEILHGLHVPFEYIESPYLFLYSLGVVLTVVIAGTIVGIVYRYTLLKAYKKFVQWLDKKWLHQIDDAINSISYQETN